MAEVLQSPHDHTESIAVKAVIGDAIMLAAADAELEAAQAAAAMLLKRTAPLKFLEPERMVSTLDMEDPEQQGGYVIVIAISTAL